MLLLLCFHWERPVGDINAGGMAATDARFVYEGRWLRGESSAEADWPCSSVRFAVGTGGRTTAAVTLVWSGVRVRLNATVHDGEGGVLALEAEGCCCSEEPAALVAGAGESGGEGAAAAN